MISRRDFFGRVAAGLVGAAVAVHVPKSWIPAPIVSRALTFKGKPFTFDKNCPAGSMYFINAKLITKYPANFGVITDIE